LRVSSRAGYAVDWHAPRLRRAPSRTRFGRERASPVRSRVTREFSPGVSRTDVRYWQSAMVHHFLGNGQPVSCVTCSHACLTHRTMG